MKRLSFYLASCLLSICIFAGALALSNNIIINEADPVNSVDEWQPNAAAKIYDVELKSASDLTVFCGIINPGAAGTMLDPFFLSNQSVFTHVYDAALLIANTRQHIVIRNLLFSSYFDAITLRNATNVRLENVTFQDLSSPDGESSMFPTEALHAENAFGVLVTNCSNILVYNCTFSSIVAGNGGNGEMTNGPGTYALGGANGGNASAILIDTSSQVTINRTKIYGIYAGSGGYGGNGDIDEPYGADGANGGNTNAIKLAKSSDLIITNTIINVTIAGSAGSGGHGTDDGMGMAGSGGEPGMSGEAKGIMISGCHNIQISTTHIQNVFGGNGGAGGKGGDNFGDNNSPGAATSGSPGANATAIFGFNSTDLNLSHLTITQVYAGSGANGGAGGNAENADFQGETGGNGGSGGSGGNGHGIECYKLNSTTLEFSTLSYIVGGNGNFGGQGGTGGLGTELPTSYGGNGGHGGVGGQGGSAFVLGMYDMHDLEIVNNNFNQMKGGNGGAGGDGGDGGCCGDGDAGNGGNGGNGGNAGSAVNLRVYGGQNIVNKLNIFGLATSTSQGGAFGIGGVAGYNGYPAYGDPGVNGTAGLVGVKSSIQAYLTSEMVSSFNEFYLSTVTDDGDNSWNDTYGGNHWSLYSGADADSNGIGDTPFTVFSTDLDQKPLMFNPFSDNDEDNLTNYEEFVPGDDGYITDLEESDSDGDGLSDWEEITIYHTNPVDHNDPTPPPSDDTTDNDTAADDTDGTPTNTGFWYGWIVIPAVIGGIAVFGIIKLRKKGK